MTADSRSNPPPPDDFDEALTEYDRAVKQHEHAEARSRLRALYEKAVEKAAVERRARIADLDRQAAAFQRDLNAVKGEAEREREARHRLIQELSQARAEVAEAQRWTKVAVDAVAKEADTELATLRAEVARLGRDSERLEQLAALGHFRVTATESGVRLFAGGVGGLVGRGSTLREAVDSADIQPALTTPRGDGGRE